MDMSDLYSYLERTIGLKVVRPKKHSPHLELCRNSSYSSFFDFDEIVLHGVSVIVAELTANVAPTKLAAIYKEMKSYFDFPVLLSLPAIDKVGRRLLLARRVNFAVPGQQLYFPELYISLQESGAIQRSNPKQLSLPAQVILLYHLQKKSLADTPLSEIAKLTGYSLKTISVSIPELLNLGIAKLTTWANRTKTLSFSRSGIDLWKQIEKYLQNPVSQRGYTDCDLEPLNPVLCGCATEHQHIPGYPYVDYGITINDARKSNLRLYATRREHSVHLWRYDPRILASNGYADILSTILTYNKFDRPQASARLLPLVKWADAVPE